MTDLEAALHYGLTRAKPDSAANVLALEVQRQADVLHAQHAELLQLRVAVASVRELHSPDGDGDCRACGIDSYEEPIPWTDCVTTAALGDPGRDLS